ncbi:MAG: uracil-DNA glycosylase, partial [Ghiorsea sp.]|nr:uracil-DNA glycosylase [Ghiorsea sp.]
MSDDFQQAYLKEIGVTTPISSFVAHEKLEIRPKPVEAQTDVKSPVYSEAKDEAPVMAAEPVVESFLTRVEPVEQEVVEKVEQASATLVDGLEGLKIKAEACKACGLVESRNQLVFGDGNDDADIVFIGEAPNRDEDLAGKTFVGASGELFQRMLASIGLNRDDVYLMHGVKCRPQHNRAPKPNEFAACESFLSAQLDKVQPKMI